MVVIGALAAGLLLPKFALSAWVKRRRRAVENELPLLIDLLSMMQGVLFSMDQRIKKLDDKLRDALPILGGELQEANVAYTHGRTRAQSLRRLSDVYGACTRWRGAGATAPVQHPPARSAPQFAE
ncbi:hypothetical protein G6F24_017504 [Rhizopus arrhizus]|nr:hypothetical protein G6F24_017504 [Rhizopus arrhizus]